MLSILIPTYNYNVTRLVADLHQQALETYVDFEIIVVEDGSTLCIDENKTVADFEFCRHIILDKNTGRSAVRNKLADEARYDHLLFIDCDAEVCSEYYVAKYVSFCKEECVVIGGTAYDPTETNSNYSLRLAYGRQREARTAAERFKNNFSTFNFLISKSIFNRVRFDENINGYGHEDMVFGHQLHQLEYEFIHIENPLLHKGLDDNETFIRKTEEGTRNLFLLYQSGNYPFLTHESKLLHSFVQLKQAGLTRVGAAAFDISKRYLLRNLFSPSPSLRLYDIYKLLFICKSSLAK
jgi:glycosyltransferase involved in cell wall biosynthesis